MNRRLDEQVQLAVIIWNTVKHPEQKALPYKN